MKKLFALLIALMMLLSLAACGNNETPSGSEGDKPGVSQNGGASNKATGGEMVEDADNSKYDEVERLSGIASIGCPVGYTVYSSPEAGENVRQVVFKADSGEVTQADIDKYAAAMWNLCIDTADDGAMFKYAMISEEKTPYSEISEARLDSGNYAWYYENDGQIIMIKVFTETKGQLELHVEKMVTD